MRSPGHATSVVLPAIAALSAVLATSCGSSRSDAVGPTNPKVTASRKAAARAAPTGSVWFTCAQPDGPYEGLRPIAAGRRLQVATTVAPITSIVANIAGDLADVAGIVPEGANSHTFEPRPSVAELLSEADLVIVNGLKLEDPTIELAETNAAPGSAIVELGTRTITAEEQIYDFSFPKEGGKPNPHLWTDPQLAACYARISADAMKAADPANAAAYEANAIALIARMHDLDLAFRAASDTVAEKNRRLLTYHDAYAYFAQTYGWTVIGAIQVGDFEEPTPREVADLIAQVKAVGVPAIFGSEVFPSPVLEQIGKEAGVEYVDELRDDDLPGVPGDDDHSYLGLMRFDLATMVKALGGDPSGLIALDVTDVTDDSARYPQ